MAKRNHRGVVFVVFSLLSTATFLVAAVPQPDPIGANLIPPDILLNHRGEIGLSDDQAKAIQERTQAIATATQQAEAAMRAAKEKLSSLLSVDTVDSTAALKQLDALVEIERGVRRSHLKLMIELRNGLTTQQRQAAMKLRRTSQVGLESRFKSKVARIEREIQTRSQNGQSPHDLMQAIQQFPKLMEKGQVNEAEALLDRLLKELGVDAADINIDRKQSNARRANRVLRVVETQPIRARDELRAEIETLQKEDVAWRQIDWKTCLLDGMKASRDQKKPIMLWVFIDRPIDDERC